MKATVFFLSDGTGITVETLGHTLLSQFDTVDFVRVRRPYLRNVGDVEKVVEEIKKVKLEENLPLLIFSTLIASESRELLHACQCTLFDFYDIFIKPMESTLSVDSSRQVGRSHGMGNFEEYQHRIDALNYTMANDDGIRPENFQDADVIILGVSRTGKTPTSLYLALNYGLRVANYPITVDDLMSENLPVVLSRFRDKLFALSINPVRLHHIRLERRSNSQYAELSQCQYEIRSAEVLYKSHQIPFLDSSTMSIEEISTSILQKKQIHRRING